MKLEGGFIKCTVYIVWLERSADVDKFKAPSICALSRHSLCFTSLLGMSFRNQGLSLQATCTFVLPCLHAHQVPERTHSFPCSDSFLLPPILPHPRWLLHTLAQWLLSFLLQGWGDHLLPVMTGRRASTQQQRLRWTRWLLSWKTPVCFIRCIKAC